MEGLKFLILSIKKKKNKMRIRKLCRIKKSWRRMMKKEQKWAKEQFCLCKLILLGIIKVFKIINYYCFNFSRKFPSFWLTTIFFLIFPILKNYAGAHEDEERDEKLLINNETLQPRWIFILFHIFVIWIFYKSGNLCPEKLLTHLFFMK